jgi:hypothetical protein
MAKPKKPTELTYEEYKKLNEIEQLYKSVDDILGAVGKEGAYDRLINAAIDTELESALAVGEKLDQKEALQRAIKKAEEYTTVGVEAGFGEFEEKKQPAAAPPLNVEQIITPTLFTAMAPQTVASQLRATTIPAISLSPQKMQESMIARGMSKEEAKIQSSAISKAYNQYKKDNPDKLLQESYQATIKEIAGISKAPTIKGYEKGSKDPYIRAFSRQITTGEVPDYTPTQLAFLSALNEAKTKSYIKKNLPAIEKGVYRYRTITTKDGEQITLPDEVYRYMKETTAPPTIFSEEKDKAISEGDAAFTTQIQPDGLSEDYEALARVRAFQTLGGDEWFLDPERKKAVLESPEEYKKGAVVPGLGETEGGWFFSQEGALGGVSESTASWALRSMMAPLNLVAGVVTDVTTTEELARLKQEERARTQPLYKDSPILANIALGKGFTGEATDAANALRVENPYARAAFAGMGFAADILDPSFALGAGTIKGAKTAAKVRKAQKAIYGATNTAEIARAATNTLKAEVMDDLNLISLVTPPKTKNAWKTLNFGDVRLHVADDLAKSLDAKRIVETSGTRQEALARIADEGLDNTTYTKQFKKEAADKDFETARNNLKTQLAQTEDTQKLLLELDGSQRYLDEYKTSGKQAADNFAKRNNLNYKPEAVADLLRITGDDATKASKLLNQQYARAIVFDSTPNINSLENIVAITRNTWSHKDNVPKILAQSVESPIGKELNAISDSGKIAKDVKPAQNSFGSLYAVGKRTAQGVPTNYFKLTNNQKQALLPLVQDLPIKQSQKDFIAQSIANNKLYLDDHRLLLDANIDQTAKALQSQIITTEDISRLPAKQQMRAMEPVGSAGRVRGFVDVIGDLFGSIGRKVLKQENAVSAPSVMKDANLNQRRLVKEIQQEASTLDTKAKRGIAGLIKSEEARAFYVDDAAAPMDRMEALGVLIVGSKQAVTKTKTLEETLEWLFARLFFEESAQSKLLDKVSGLHKLRDSNLLNDRGRIALATSIKETAETLSQNPRNFWQIINDWIDEWAIVLEQGTIDGKRIINIEIRPKNIVKITDDKLAKIQGQAGLGMYYYAESSRILDKKLVEIVQKDFKPTTTKDLFPNQNVSQRSFEAAVKNAVLQSYSKNLPYEEILGKVKQFGVPDNIARKAIEYGNVIIRNEGLDDYMHLSVPEMKSMLNNLFGGQNEGFARVLFGSKYYDELANELAEGRAMAITKHLDQVIQDMQNNARFLPAMKKFLNMINSFRYSAILAARPRFHGSNILTANAILYSTVGRMIGARATKKGFDVAFKASSEGAAKVNQIAVRTKDGKVFTYGEIYEAVRVSGVRSEYNFVTSALDDSSFIKWLENQNKKGVGFGRVMMDFLKQPVNQTATALNELTVLEDMVFRAGSMIKALEEGRSIEEATALARRSLFDYNDMFAWEKAISTQFFIFYSFTRQNFVTMFKSLTDLKLLKRYINVLKFDRGAEALTAEMNDRKKYNHQAFFPNYTMSRQLLSVQDGQDKDYYDAGPPIPAIDALLLGVEIAQAATKLDVSQLFNKQLAPHYKLLLGLNDAGFGTKTIPPEYINLMIMTYSEDPTEIAGLLEKIVGGQVKPTPARQEVGGVTGITKTGETNTYIYPLDSEQQKRWNLFSKFVLDYPGLSTPARDYSRFFAPEGTTAQKLTGMERIAYAVGAITPMRIARETKQDAAQLMARSMAIKAEISRLTGLQKKAQEREEEKRFQQ